MKKGLSIQTTSWFLITIFLFLVAGILITGFLFYQKQRERIKTEAQNNLAAIADLKVDQIIQWRDEQINDAKIIYNDVLFAKQVETYFKAPAAMNQKQELLNSIKTFQHNFNYESISLIDAKGNVCLSISANSDTTREYSHALIKEAFLERRPIFSDLNSTNFSPSVHINLVIPLILSNRKDSTMTGGLLLRIDPNQSLFPIIRKWPTPSRSSETLLLERSFNEVVYLNDLRYQKKNNKIFRIPISREELPASMVERGIEEIVEGKDYRNVPVLAVVKKIQNTPWFIIAKVDQEEIFAPLKLQAWIVGLGMFLLILSTGAIIGFWWRHQRALFYREKYLAELERQVLVKHYDYIIKYANDIALLINMDGRIVEANDQACRNYGYTREELFRLDIRDLRSPKTRAHVDKQMKQVEEQGELLFETEHVRKDGTVFPVEDSSRFIKIEGTKFYQSIVRDITKRKRTEEALRESERRFRALIENSSDAFSLIDPNGKILYRSPSARQVVDIPDEEIVSSNMFDRIWLEDIDNAKRTFAQILQSPGKCITFQYRVKNENGSPRWIEGIGNNLLTDPAVHAIVFNYRDITERIRAEETIQRERNLLRTLIDNLPDGIYVKDSACRKTIANPADLHNIGCQSEAEILGKDDFDVYPKEIAEKFFADDQSVIQTGKPVLNREEYILDAEGKKRWLFTSKLPLRDEKGQIIGLVGIGRDITERKRAEEALRESEEKYKTLIETTDTGYLILDAQGRVIDANKEYIRLTGYDTLDEILGRSVVEWTALHDLERNAIEVKKCVEQGYIRNLEIDYINRSEQITPIEINATVVGSGDSVRILSLCRDITERKRAKETLRQSESLFKMLVESSPVAITVFSGPSNKLEYVNYRFIELFGYGQEDLPTMDAWWPLAYPMEEYRNQIEAAWRTSIKLSQRENREPEPIESVVTCKDGLTKYIESTFTSMSDHTLVFFTDLTQRRMAEESLRQTHTFNDLLIQTMPFGMNIVDEEGNILFVSKTMKEMLTVDVVDMCCWKVYKDDNQQCQDCPLKRGISFGKPGVIETTGVLDGKTFQISHVGMMYEGRKAMLEVFQDITEQKKLQQELMQNQKMLSIGTLAGGIAHDFNNILAIILGCTSIFNSIKDDPQKLSDGVNAIRQAVDRGAALVRQILTFARKTDIAFEPMSVPDLIRELISMLEQTFPKIITFNKEIEIELPLINADHTQIHQILLNLCVNARDAMLNGGVITIKANIIEGDRLRERFPAANEEHYICITVSDTGMGMDEATRSRIFDPFFTTKEKGKGTGLGLSVVYGVVQAHHGFIDVESAVGSGTTFRLYLPVAKESSAALESSKEEERVLGGNETILVVEDEELLLDMVKIFLETHGYTVLTAKDGIEAVNVYSEHVHEIALVISDMGLPKLPGDAEFKKLKEINPAVKMILASGYFEPDIKALLENAGVVGFLQKPYLIEEILEKIRKALD